jgi:biopolymer transport protein ExbD
MRRKRVTEDLSEGTHERPWVWCMIDAFALIMAFFVSTFHVRQVESVLPQALSKSGGPPNTTPPTIVNDQETLRVSVSRENGAPVYTYHSVRGTLADLDQSLAGASQSGRAMRVKIAYESGVPFGDVLAVLNSCTRAGIRDVGLIPARG